MGKTGKWFRNLLTGKKDTEKDRGKCGTTYCLTNATENNPTSTVPKEKKRWSFRRSSASKEVKEQLNQSVTVQTEIVRVTDEENDQGKHALAADADAATAVSPDTVICLDSSSTRSIQEEAAAIKIQSVFRSYLARKALCALRGLVKLQALIRGHLVRKQATDTLRCMQALVTAQERARAQRALMAEVNTYQEQLPYRKVTEETFYMHMYNEMDRGYEENIKIVEMDVCESKGNSRGRNNTSKHGHHEFFDHRFSTYYSSNGSYSKEEKYKVSPAPSALTESSPRASSGHFEDYSFGTAQSSPHYYSSVSRTEDSKLPFAFHRPSYAESMSYDYPLYPNYMANTESSRAKVRSHSAPKQRPESYERQPSRRRPSVEGRNVPRPVRMQRSSSHVGATAHEYQYPWSIKLDRSTVSLVDSECGSTTSTIISNSNYCRSLVACEPHGYRY